MSRATLYERQVVLCGGPRGVRTPVFAVKGRWCVERDAAPEWQKVADRSVSGEAAAQERRKQQAIGDDAVKKATKKQ